MFCGARFFNQPLNQLPRLRATPGGSGAVTARLALTGTLITGNLPIITPRRGSGVNNPVNNPTGFRLNTRLVRLTKDPSGRADGRKQPVGLFGYVQVRQGKYQVMWPGAAQARASGP